LGCALQLCVYVGVLWCVSTVCVSCVGGRVPLSNGLNQRETHSFSAADATPTHLLIFGNVMVAAPPNAAHDMRQPLLMCSLTCSPRTASHTMGWAESDSLWCCAFFVFPNDANQVNAVPTQVSVLADALIGDCPCGSGPLCRQWAALWVTLQTVALSALV
jgi:hypothetical protein